MTRFALIACLILTLSLKNLGQEVYSLEQGPVQIHKKEHYALKLTMVPDKKDAKDAWEKFLKKAYSVKCKGKWSLESENCNIPEISGNNLNLYTEIEENQEQKTLMIFFFSFGEQFADPIKFSSEFSALKSIVDRFAKSYLTSYYEQLLRKDEKKLKELSKSNKKLNKAYQDGSEQIQNMMKKKEKLLAQVHSNQGDLEEISAQIKDIDNQITETKSTINDLQTKIQQNQKAILVYQKNIEQYRQYLIILDPGKAVGK